MVFFAVLGASSYTYSEAVGSQSLPEWISAHVKRIFDGVPRQFVCDNLRSGITRACFYEPLVNRTHADSRSICPRCSGCHRAFRVCRMEALARYLDYHVEIELDSDVTCWKLSHHETKSSDDEHAFAVS